MIQCQAFSQGNEVIFDVFAGKVWKHKEALLYETPAVSSGFQIGVYRDLKSTSFWKNKWNHPKLGLAYSFLSFGDKEVLGFAHSVFPNAYFNVFNRERIKVQVSAGFGISYLTRTYQNQINETNNAIGSSINNISKIGIGLRHQFNQISIRAGVDFTHYSNGGTKSPNSGINVVTGSFSMIKSFGVQEKKTLIEPSDDGVNNFKRHGFNLQYHIGITEDDVLNGPKYLIHAVSAAYRFKFSRAYSLLAGLEYEYNYAKFHFELNAFQDRETASRRAKQWVYIIAQEFQLVDFSLRTQIGIYSNQPVDNNNDPFYFKLIPQYNIRVNNLPYVQSIGLGVALKSHYAKAEFLGLSMNINFGNY